VSAPEPTCPHCGAAIAAGDAFCESCGTALDAGAAAGVAGAETGDESARTHLIRPPGAGGEGGDDSLAPAESGPTRQRPCAACGGEVGADGYCTVCGVRASNGREHVVITASSTVAGVSDKGRVHPRNEDALAIEVTTDRSVLVVCDGVTTSTHSDIASQAAADAAAAVISKAAAAAGKSPAARVTHWAEVLQQAGVAADHAAATATAGLDDTAGNPASCTFVCAVVDSDLITAGWVGDSRAYWLPDPTPPSADGSPAANPAEQLSIDDSWATEQVALGITREVADADPRAHAITRWLGPDSPPIQVRTATTTVATPGWLLVCSDGLWNYCSEAADLTALIAGTGQTDPTQLAEALITWANQQGGHDNITAVLARLAPAARP
jgi:serine/threonine protein phosphatase PrpC